MVNHLEHGDSLLSVLSNRLDRHIYFVKGEVDVQERQKIIDMMEKNDNIICIAMSSIFSTGINIKNLHNVIFASPSKSRIRNLQSIGRVLRKGKDKVKAVLYDIADDCTNKSKRNYTLNHFIERIKIYNEEKFNYEIITIQLKV